MGEVSLWKDQKEREMYDNFADLFAIIRTTEKLEKAYVRDVISALDYELMCTNLIAQFKTLRSTVLKDSVPDIERFMETYRMDCPAAAARLLVSGIPATVEHKSASSSEPTTNVAVAECTQSFITSMDSLKLNMIAVDQVHPLILDLLASLNKIPQLPADFQGKVKARDWITCLNKMGASEELNDTQVRQLLFDLESSYNLFMVELSNPSKSRS